jgi:hypothetical protein
MRCDLSHGWAYEFLGTGSDHAKLTGTYRTNVPVPLADFKSTRLCAISIVRPLTRKVTPRSQGAGSGGGARGNHSEPAHHFPFTPLSSSSYTKHTAMVSCCSTTFHAMCPWRKATLRGLGNARRSNPGALFNAQQENYSHATSRTRMPNRAYKSTWCEMFKSSTQSPHPARAIHFSIVIGTQFVTVHMLRYGPIAERK